MIIETTDLTKTYGDKTILDKVNVHVQQGQIYGFVGKNGAGKTTFMKMICGLIQPTSGSFKLLDNDNVYEARRQIGCLIEAPSLYKDMTAKQNLIYYSKMKGVEGLIAPEELLEKVGLRDVEKKKAGSFSLGMKQRLSIAIAMVNDPKLLVLDEPINGLDPTGIKEVRETLMGLRDDGKTIFISSHIMGELERVATDYGIIAGGHLVEEFSAQELQNKVSQCAHVQTDDDVRAMQALKEHFHIEKIEKHNQSGFVFYELLDQTAQINRFLNEEGFMVSRIEVSGTDAEEYFLSKMN